MMGAAPHCGTPSVTRGSAGRAPEVATGFGAIVIFFLPEAQCCSESAALSLYGFLPTPS